MAQKVLLATDKAFAQEAVQQMEAIFKDAKYEFVKLENYKERSEFLTAAADCDAMIIRSDKATADLFDAAKKLKLIVRGGAGVDNIDLSAATAKGVVAMNTPGQNSNAVAELAFGMMVRQLRNQYDGSSGRELKGRTLGLVGCGAVGVCMATVAKGFGMKVLGVDPFLNARQIIQRGAEPAESVADIFKRCDFVSLHIPATNETKNSIGKELLMSMPKGATLINTARLEVVDEAGLIEALTARPDLGYLSDVQLADAANVKSKLGETQFAKQIFQTPKKMGAQTEEANVNSGVAAAHQIVAFLEKGEAGFQVNRVPGAPNPSIYKSSLGDVSLNVSDIIGDGRVVNFSAGPCCLPIEVLQSARDNMLSWEGSGSSVLEMSHRSKEYESIINQAEKDMRELLSVPNNFKILFLQGGATSQFAAVPLNLLG